MTRLNVLQIFSRYLHYGGEEGSVFRIGDALQARHNLEYFINSSEELTRGNLLRKFTVPLRAFYNYPILKTLDKYQKIGRFDCWQIHNVFPSISPGAYSLAFKLGIPIIHYLHNYKLGCANGFMFHHGKENRDCIHGNFWPAIRDRTWHDSFAHTAVMGGILAYSRSRLKVLDRITRWIAISQAQKDIHVQMGIPSDRIDVVPHFLKTTPGVSPPPFPANGHGLFVGRLSPEKGVDRLLHAWTKISPDRKLVIMGDGPEMEPLKALTIKLNLKNVVFTGFLARNAQAEVWKETAFSIVPSIWQEPFGMVVLEAWAKARPVVAHSIGALPEIIRDGEDGFLADPNAPEALSTALERAFSNTTDLRQMGLTGLNRLNSDYNKLTWLDRIDDVYRKAGLL
ncbi:glycosyltransferase family 4 protein [Luteolibacter pohnpeiensis]|uniref:Glycosyltransferase family 4 protein n=1 Tax=Luteolibacter pohnpeiensis TaxID=454153 RepID=A0A934VQU9_9BACT|nr:glycosyltransferase family 4 protein [Luteolibacter pohnpeiensis]MBK1882486.1 glycosyltransferase family 4 protein [Luteolibacter pohnpeiensis]